MSFHLIRLRHPQKFARSVSGRDGALLLSGRRLRQFFWLTAATVVAQVAAAAEPVAESAAPSEFMPAVQLAPFVVNGEPLSISVHARSKADRKYAERFAEEVIEVAYETLDGSVGAGLVIMGKEGEPHPVFVFRRFLKMS